MGEQNTTEKKRFINFKFGIRKEIIKAVAFMAVFMVIMLIGVRIFGRSNGMAFGMAIMGMLMTITVDMTLEPVKNLFMLIGSNVFMVFMSFLAYGLFPENTPGRIVMMPVSTFVVFFIAISLFTSEEYGNTYMPLLLSFSLLIYYNSNTTVTSAMGSGTEPGSINIVSEMLIRMAIYAGAAVLGMLLNFLVHGRKFRKKIRAALNDSLNMLKKQTDDIFTGSASTTELADQSKNIDAALSAIESTMGTKMSIRYKWQSGHDTIRTVTILKRINNTLSKSYIECGESMTNDIHYSLYKMLDSIDRFAKNDGVNTYLLADEEWINRLSMITHRMKTGNITLGRLRTFVSDSSRSNASLTPRQYNILAAFDEVLEEIAAAEQKNSHLSF